MRVRSSIGGHVLTLAWLTLILDVCGSLVPSVTRTKRRAVWGAPGSANSRMGRRFVRYVESEDSLQRYLKILGRSNLLTVEEERVLSLDVQELVRWQAVRAELAEAKQREPTQSEWSEAVGFAAAREARGWQYGDGCDLAPCFEGQLRRLELAKERMIESNLRLVVTIAEQFANRGVALQDLIQEGTLGLIHAVERYRGDNPSRAKFASYASWWIKLSISRAVGSGRTIRLPARLPGLIAQASRHRDAFELEHGREPSNEELAKMMGVSQDRLRLVLSSSKSLLSLDGQAVSTAPKLALCPRLPAPALFAHLPYRSRAGGIHTREIGAPAARHAPLALRRMGCCAPLPSGAPAPLPGPAVIPHRRPRVLRRTPPPVRATLAG